jgi:transposase
MEILYECCAGIDVHKETVSVCVMRSGAAGTPEKEVQQFGTTTGELRRLSDWLREEGVTHAAMESTGVYWKPVFNVLESSCELILVNARHIRQVPGRKTDQADCIWITSLLRHGLLEASFVPSMEIRQLRDLCRTRTTLVRERVQVGNRIRKVLEDANIKLDSVATDVFGASGRAMIHALINGEQDPAALADLARRKLRSKIPQLREALEGQVTPHHRFLLAELMESLEFLDRKIERFEREIDKQMLPFEEAAALLMTTPGIDRTAACALIAEIGVDMTRFPSARHLASWSGMCPGNNQSAGRTRSGKSYRGNRWIKGLLTQIAWAASHTKNTYAQEFFRRLARSRGKKRALVALANSLVQAVWFMLTHRQAYADLGATFFDQLHAKEKTRAMVKRLQRLGYEVILKPSAA